MMKYISTLVRAAAASLIVATGANAAILEFDIDNTVNPVSSLVCADANCNFTVTSALPDTVSVNTNGSPSTFPFLSFSASSFRQQGLLDLVRFDTFSINAILSFALPNFSASAGGSNGSTLISIPLLGQFNVSSPILVAPNGSFYNASVAWNAIAPILIPGIGTASVAFEDIQVGPFLTNRPTSFVVAATVSLQPIPLPGGILLLGSAMLGIFGLSRRRNRKLAAA